MIKDEIEIRAARADDLPGVKAVASACVDLPVWSAEAWDACLRPGAVGRFLLVADARGTLAGFVVVAIAAELAELESVAVVATVRGQGVGRQLCEAAMERARLGGAAAMELEVRASNVAARGLYRTLGFVEQGRRAGYYRDPVEDAVLMAMELVPR